MLSFSIVEDLNVPKNGTLGGIKIHKRYSSHQFFFESCKEAFSHRIVPTISSTAHALYRPYIGQLFLESLTQVLTALVGMKNDPNRRSAISNGHLQSIAYDSCRHIFLERPTGDTT